MNMEQRRPIVVSIIGMLRDQGSWCGETHIQKATHCIQEITQLDLGFTFVLYKHGPFSFDLRDELTQLQAYDLITIQTNQPPYGPSLLVTERGKEIRDNLAAQAQASPETRRTLEKIRFIAERLGTRGVAELERLATAVYATNKNRERSLDDRAQEICNLKPHVSQEQALSALEEADYLLAESSRRFAG